MSQLIWRVVRNRYSQAGLTGEGARIHGGRWTSPGYPVIYCAQNLSLAVLEILVHTDNKRSLSGFSKIALHIPGDKMHTISQENLPEIWDAPFPGPELQKIGDQWLLSQKSLILSIPSVLIHEEYNYLINPLHPDFSSLNISAVEPLALDKRLFSDK